METSPILAVPPAPALIQLPSAGRIFKQALKFYTDHWPVLVGISAIPLIFSIPQMLSIVALSLGKEILPVVAIFVLGILSAVASLISRTAFFDALAENGEPSGGIAGAYSKGLHMLIPFLWISILTALAALGGFILLIVPGILVSLWLSMSIFILFTENRRGLSALTTSWHYVKGYLGSIFIKGLFLGVIIWLLYAAGALVFGVVASVAGEAVHNASAIVAIFFAELFAAPISIIYFYLVYQSLKYAKAQIPIEAEEPGLKKKVVTFLILGLAALLIFAAVAAAAPYWFHDKIGPLRFSPPQFNTSSAAAPWRMPLASMGFAPLLNFLSFGR